MFKERYKSHHDAEHEYQELLNTQMSNSEELVEFLKTVKTPDGEHCVYIHIPFCDRICSFCNLNRKILQGGLDEYTENVVEQIRYYGQFPYIKNMKVRSVYFGGGTPSVLEASHYEQILQALRENLCLVDGCEISTETTLHNMGVEKLRKLEALGVNRISIGIQTFQTEGRKFFNRTGTKEFVVDQLKALRMNFQGIIAIDKIYHYPGETIDDLLADIAMIKELDIDSVSFYSLMIHTGSALSKRGFTNQELTEGDEEFHDTFYREMIKENAYELLELTKLAKKGKDSYQYITLRNNGANTLPIGAGAGGNIESFGIFQMTMERTMVVKREERAQLAERIYGMMQIGVIRPAFLKENGVWKESVQEKLKTYEDSEYIFKENDEYRLTPKGLFYGNNLCADLTKEVLTITK